MNKTLANSQIKFGTILVVALLVLLVGVLVYMRFQPTTKDEVRIVVLLPETGKNSFIGMPFRRGMELAKEMLASTLKDKTIRLIFEDFGEDTTKGVQALQQYLEGPNKAHAVVSVLTGMTNAVKDDLDKRKIPLFAVTIHPTITQGYRYVFRVYYSAGAEGEALAKMMESMEAKRVALVVSTDPQTDFAVKNYLIPAMNRLRIQKVFDDNFKVGTTDFANLVARLKAMQPDTVLVPGAYATDVRALIKELVKQKVVPSAHLVGGIAFLDIATKFPSEAIDGMQFVAPPLIADGAGNQLAKDFLSRYENKYHEKPVHEAGYGFDTINVLISAVLKTKTLDGQDLADSIRNVQELEGVNGNISIDKNDDSRMNLVPCIFSNGKVHIQSVLKKKAN